VSGGEQWGGEGGRQGGSGGDVVRAEEKGGRDGEMGKGRGGGVCGVGAGWWGVRGRGGVK